MINHTDRKADWFAIHLHVLVSESREPAGGKHIHSMHRIQPHAYQHGLHVLGAHQTITVVLVKAPSRSEKVQINVTANNVYHPTSVVLLPAMPTLCRIRVE